MAWRSNKKGLAIVGLFLFLMGVAVPAAFGLMTEKAMQLGVGDLLDKSTNWDESNIANSTYFVKEDVEFLDNQTGSLYALEPIYDSSNDLDDALIDTTTDIISTTNSKPDTYYMWIVFNKTSFEKVDKIVVLFRILDTGSQTLDTVKIYAYLESYKWGDDYSFLLGVYNATEAYNNTLRIEIPIDAVKHLKISSSSSNPCVHLYMRSDSGLKDLNGMIVGYRVELYDVKKVNATAASNIMLAVSGVLGWLGALAATPYWNPMKNPEHRNVRRVGHAIRRRIPRRRR